MLSHLRPSTPGLYWIVGPTYDLARPEFGYVAEALQQLGIISSISWPRTGGCALDTRYGHEIITRSADDPITLAGTAPDGILMCEAAQQSYETFLRLRGRLAEKRGWLWASGTFEGSLGWYAEYFKRWQADNPEDGRSFSIPTWSNLAIYPGGRTDPEILALEATYPHDLFLERFGAEPCPPSTLVFRDFQFATHVRQLPELADGERLELAIDPGYASAYSVCVVVQRGWEVHIIDEVYERGLTGQEIIRLCKQKPWWWKIEKDKDGTEKRVQRVTTGVIDVAGTQHQAAPSQVEVWQKEAGVRLRYSQGVIKIPDGTNRLHTFLKDPESGQPRILFSSKISGRGVLSEFGLYRYAEMRENMAEREAPIDRDNHSIKALSYWLIDKFGPVDRPEVDWSKMGRERSMW